MTIVERDMALHSALYHNCCFDLQSALHPERTPMRALGRKAPLLQPGQRCRWGSPGVPQLQRRRQAALERVRPHDSAAGALGSLDQPDENPRPVDPWNPSAPTTNSESYPRRRERNPYKRLGLPEDASFEEVIDAKMFLAEQYQGHEPSREAIELAYEAIMEQDLKDRRKYGFQPPSSGRKSDLRGDEKKKNLVELFKERLEPALSAAAIVNDGAIFAILGLWAAVMSTTYDPTLPLGGALCYCGWRLFAKRRLRSPEGPYWGNSPVWGALLTTLVGLAAGGLVSWLIVQYVPLPPMVQPEAIGIFIIFMLLAATCIFFK